MASTERFLRVDRLVSVLGLSSRRGANGFIRSRVTVDGVCPPSQTLRVDPARVAVDGVSATLLLAPLHIALHKPPTFLCSRAREQDSAVVYDLLPAAWARRRPGLEVCGRLDKHASGLVLLSQDGKINFAAIARGHEREYEVRLAKPVSSETESLFASGKMMLRGEETPLLPAQLTVTSADGQQARVVLREGRYHQLRRMFEAAGNTVEAIKRVRIAGVSLGDLGEGKHRVLTDQELASLQSKQ